MYTDELEELCLCASMPLHVALRSAIEDCKTFYDEYELSYMYRMGGVKALPHKIQEWIIMKLEKVSKQERGG